MSQKEIKIKFYQGVGKYDYKDEETGKNIVRKRDINFKLKHSCGRIRAMPKYSANVIWCGKCKEFFNSNTFVKVNK